jgi:hypothetical protein
MEPQRRPLLRLSFLLLRVLFGCLTFFALPSPLRFVCNGLVSTIQFVLYLRAHLSAVRVLCLGDPKVNLAGVFGP